MTTTDRSDWKSFAMVVLSIVLCAPSYMAWWRRDLSLGEQEFDWWLGLGPSLFWGKVAHTVLFGLLGWLFVEHLLSDRPIKRWLPYALVAVYAFAVPWVSPDVTFYLAEGWIEVHYGVDPYVIPMTVVDPAASDPMIRAVAPTIRPVVGNYGALFQLFSRWVAALSGGNPMLGLFLFKVAAVVSLLVIARLIDDQVIDEQGDRMRARWMLLCNPLVLFNSVTAVHNDILFLVPVVFAVRILWKRPCIAGILLGATISLKLFALFLLPVWVLSVARSTIAYRVQSAVTLVWSTILGWGLGVLPNLESLSYVLRWLNNESALVRPSLHLVAEPLVDLVLGSSGITSMLIGKVCFVALAGMFLLRNHQRMPASGSVFLVKSSFEVLLLMQALVLYMINEWYLLWPMVFASAIAQRYQFEWVAHTGLLVMPVTIWALQGSRGVMVAAYAMLVVVYGAAIVLQLRQNWTGWSTRYSLGALLSSGVNSR